MAAFHPPIVALAPQRVAAQRPAQRRQEARAQLLHPLRVIPTKLHPPVGLEGHRRLHPPRPQPGQHQQQECQPVRGAQGMTEGQEAQPRTPVAGRPLVARQPLAGQMCRQRCPQAALIANVFDVRLDQREGLLALPGPQRRIDAPTTLTWAHQTVAPQDVADGVGGDRLAVLGQIPGQPPPPQLGLLVGPHHQLLELRWRLTRRMVRAARAVGQPRLPLLLVALHPLAHHLPRGVPQTRRLADAAGLLNRAQQLLSCLNPIHSVYFPIGQLGHRRCSS